MISYYDNIAVLSDKDESLGFINTKRAEKFLSWGIMVWVEENRVLKMTREPTGGIVRHKTLITPRKNVCVVCGTNDDCSFHHIVPRCYKKYFPNSLKSHNNYDVMLMCIPCHRKYERVAYEFKKQLAEKYGTESVSDMSSEARTKSYAVESASTLLKHGTKMPSYRIAQLQQNIKKFIKKELLTERDITEIALLRPEKKTASSYLVAQKLKTEEEIKKFIITWREHFLNTMKPKFMPDFWKSDEDAYDRISPKKEEPHSVR
jgi:hypothetical protein